MSEYRARPPLRDIFTNALRRRCPNCKRGPIFANRLNKVLPRCPQCGLPYFRESGYYLGGMIITYVLTAFTLLFLYLGSLLLPALGAFSENLEAVFWIALAILLTFLYVRPAYSLWLALDFWIDPWEPDAARASTTEGHGTQR